VCAGTGKAIGQSKRSEEAPSHDEICEDVGRSSEQLVSAFAVEENSDACFARDLCERPKKHEVR
jgi:hypothetical protein